MAHNVIWSTQSASCRISVMCMDALLVDMKICTDMACAQVCTQVVEFLRLQVFLALPSSLSHSNLSNKAGRGAASSPVHSPVFGFMKEKGGYSASTVHVHSDDSDNWVPRRPWQGMLCKHVLAHSGKQNRVHSC
eukprot:1155506-Pelagomonas_calceolata.AAC.9